MQIMPHWRASTARFRVETPNFQETRSLPNNARKPLYWSVLQTIYQNAFLVSISRARAWAERDVFGSSLTSRMAVSRGLTNDRLFYTKNK